MTTVVPQGDDLRKAVRFVSEGLQYEPEKTVQALIETACLKFNLSPKDQEYLIRFFGKK